MINGLYQPVSYAGDGAQTVFPITFEFVSSGDIRALVRVNGLDTTLTPGVDFTVSGTALTTVTAPESGATLIVYMEMPFTQKTDYRNTGKLSLEVLEKDLDKASLISQELRDITLRCVKVPVGSTEDPDDYIVEIRDAVASTASDADTARIAAQAAQAAAEAAAANVGSYKHFATATAGQTAIDTPWTFDPVAGNIFLIIGGVPQVPSSYTLTDSNTITLSEALLGGETIAVYSLTTPAAGSTPLYADQNLADVLNKAMALSNLGGAAKSANLSDLANAATARGNLGVKAPSEVAAYTRQQYAPPVVVAPASGAVTLDASLHQNCKITSTVALTMNAPANAVEGMTLFIRLYADSALAITWNAVFVAVDNASLPTAHVAGKDMYMQFYFDGANWVLTSLFRRA